MILSSKQSTRSEPFFSSIIVKVIYIRSLIPLLLLLSILSSCRQQMLVVETDYVSYKDLASYHVETPDPHLLCPDVGQKLIISWNIPPNIMKNNPEIRIHLLLKNRQEYLRTLHPKNCSGRYIYSILNAHYFTTGGILTYKVELIANEEPLATTRHLLWTELLKISSS